MIKRLLALTKIKNQKKTEEKKASEENGMQKGSKKPSERKSKNNITKENIENSDDKTMIIEREYNQTKSDNKSKLNILL